MTAAPEWKPRSKRKRWARKGPTPNELFPALSTTPLFGLLEGRFVWVPADERTAKLLDGACVGSPAGGARSAADAAAAAAAVFGAEAVSAAVSEERGGAGVCVRLSLEEAIFLVHVLGTLRVVVEQEAQEAVERSEGKKEGESEHKEEREKGEEEEPPRARVAREMGGEELWRFACLQASSKSSSYSSSIRASSCRRSGEGGEGGEGGGEEEEYSDGDGDGDGDGGGAGAFLRSYAAFHHFRCKGWTVRSGLRYGCDFVLYRGHPASSHADVCVLAVRRDGGGGGGGGSGRGGGGGGGDQGSAGRKTSRLPFFTPRESPSRRAGPLTWLDVEIGNRLAAQVGKRLLLLHVQVGRGGEDGEEEEGPGKESGVGGAPLRRRRRRRSSLLSLTAAEALSRVTVEERLVERWVPDVDREEPVV